MAAADTKPKAGDLVLLRRSAGGQSAGLHWVVDVVEGAVIAETLTGNWPQRFPAPFEDIVRFYRGQGDAAAMTLDPRPEAKAEPAEPRPEPPGRFVKVHLIGARPEGKTIGRKLDDGRLVTKHYTPAPIPVMVDQAGQGHFEIGHLDDSGQWQEGVDAIDLGKFLQLDGAHQAARCGEVAVFASSRDPQFSEDS